MSKIHAQFAPRLDALCKNRGQSLRITPNLIQRGEYSTTDVTCQRCRNHFSWDTWYNLATGRIEILSAKQVEARKASE